MRHEALVCHLHQTPCQAFPGCLGRCLAPNRNGWRGEIYVGGERFVKYDTDKAVVLAWLDDMNAKKQALAKIDKLKGRKR